MVSGHREIFGPQLIGQALTPHIPSWFGRTIHLDLVKEGARSVRRAFYKTHFYEGNKIPYVANPRLPITVEHKMPESEIVTPDGLFVIRLFDKIKELRAEAKELALKNS